MKVLIATNETQGSRPGDVARTVEGELVTPVDTRCTSPRTCGCGRGFHGLASGGMTTTAMVVDRPALIADDLWDAVTDALERDGVDDIDRLGDAAFDALVSDHLTCIEAVCAAFEVGTVVNRWGHRVYARTTTSTHDDRAA